jgi:amino acid transporter
MLNSVYCVAEFLEFLAFIHLRFKYPDLHRPFAIPLGNVGCCFLLLGPVTVLSFVFMLPVVAGRWEVLLYVFAVFLVGNVLYVVLEVFRRTGLCKFTRRPPSGAHELVAIYKTPPPQPVRGITSY